MNLHLHESEPFNWRGSLLLSELLGEEQPEETDIAATGFPVLLPSSLAFSAMAIDKGIIGIADTAGLGRALLP